MERMVATSAELYGDIDILVNNAGVFPNILVMNMETDDFARVLNVNLLGVFLCTRYVAKHMIERNHGGGSSTSPPSCLASFIGRTGSLRRLQARRVVIHQNIALELAPHRIWVNAIAPTAGQPPVCSRLRRAHRYQRA